jgi:hypothetical protein
MEKHSLPIFYIFLIIWRSYRSQTWLLVKSEGLKNLIKKKDADSLVIFLKINGN